MNKRSILLVIIVLLMTYPAITGYLVLRKLDLPGTELNKIEESIVSYQLSIWLTWVILIIISINYKWRKGKNHLFIVTYGFLVVAFSLFGYCIQKMVNHYNLRSNFEDVYSLGFFTAIQNLVIAAVLTGFLQAAVWWFTKRWHRR